MSDMKTLLQLITKFTLVILVGLVLACFPPERCRHFPYRPLPPKGGERKHGRWRHLAAKAGSHGQEEREETKKVFFFVWTRKEEGRGGTFSHYLSTSPVLCGGSGVQKGGFWKPNQHSKLRVPTHSLPPHLQKKKINLEHKILQPTLKMCQTHNSSKKKLSMLL